MMQKAAKLYEGKAKIMYQTDEPEVVLQFFKDSATAFDGKKKGEIEAKGTANCQISSMAFDALEDAGIRTHFIKCGEKDNEMFVKRLDMLGLEVVVRNVAAGSLAKRLGYPEQQALKGPIVEFYYKDDSLGDPLINDDHIFELGLADRKQLDDLREKGHKINEVLTDFFSKAGLILVDFKLEFGLDKDGELILGDEISPDTCRLWDSVTLEKLDKDRFRRDLGGVEDAYREVLRRLKEVLGLACGESK